MENKKKLTKVRIVLLIIVLIEVGCLIGGIELYNAYGYWWAMALGWAIFIGLNGWLLVYYHKNISYKCPECGNVFKPTFWNLVWSMHTPTLRRLKCPKCNQKSWCKEVYIDKTTDNK